MLAWSAEKRIIDDLIILQVSDKLTMETDCTGVERQVQPKSQGTSSLTQVAG